MSVGRAPRWTTLADVPPAAPPPPEPSPPFPPPPPPCPGRPAMPFARALGTRPVASRSNAELAAGGGALAGAPLPPLPPGVHGCPFAPAFATAPALGGSAVPVVATLASFAFAP